MLFPDPYMTALKTASFKSGCLPILAALALLTLTACQSKPEAIVAPAAAPTAKISDEANKEIPSDLYKGMPIYPGAVVTHVHKPKGAMREVIFELKNSPSLNQMVSFYKEGFKAGDFKITSSLIMPARKTWSCDFHKDGRPGSVMLYPSDNDKTSTTIDLIYEMASNIDPNLLEPKEDFDVIGPGAPGGVTPVAQTVATGSNGATPEKSTAKNKAKRK
ncbi:MAG TPA: hypothetical protein VMT64_11785 [Candidatus Binataceae bacterium]|nr:hypothetical protein [Candidatus Binataceae bacterium]